MVKLKAQNLDRTFAALSDPTRRQILSRLQQSETLTISELANPLDMSMPAVMKHLTVLSSAGLIDRTKTGRTVTCRLQATPMAEAMKWLETYERFWSAGLDRLATFVEDTTPVKEKPCRNQPSRSSAASTPRPKPSSPRGRTPKN